MLQRVNKVFVADGLSGGGTNPKDAQTGELIVQYKNEDGAWETVDSGGGSSLRISQELRVGLVTDVRKQLLPDDTSLQDVAIIDWANTIQKNSINSIAVNEYAEPVEDRIDFIFDDGDFVVEVGHRYVLRIQRTDIWEHPGTMTYSYEYIAKTSNLGDLVDAFVKKINKDDRPGVYAEKMSSDEFRITAYPKTDSEGLHPVDTYTQVTIDAFMYKTIPSGILATTPIELTGLEKRKYNGTQGNGYWKVVRDRENRALGYRGITYRENAVYPYIAPELRTKINGEYNEVIVEYNNKYRSPNVQYRYDTPLTIEVYFNVESMAAHSSFEEILKDFAGFTSI